jgi:hypothetical protein
MHRQTLVPSGRIDRSDDNAQIPRHLRDDAPARNTIARVDHNDESAPTKRGILDAAIPIDGPYTY